MKLHFNEKCLNCRYFGLMTHEFAGVCGANMDPTRNFKVCEKWAPRKKEAKAR